MDKSRFLREVDSTHGDRAKEGEQARTSAKLGDGTDTHKVRVNLRETHGKAGDSVEVDFNSLSDEEKREVLGESTEE